ncbi:LamG-like jellyroll fold domain-containing protein [Flavisericum labens]|uniref:LamG-like jellyroll fold domain-containing protein n=1 Tax=Flavisericum labens TaxID=3377112 RepID=UPI00387B3E21
MKNLTTGIVGVFICLCLLLGCKNLKETKQSETGVQWILPDFLGENSKALKISGNPQLTDSPYGKVVYFDGEDDAFFLDLNPLESFNEFTIEMIFKPAIDGDFEQRIVHIGEVSGDRMLLEIRAIDGLWYFDGFVASKENKKALIDSTLIHPLAKWYHVAFVVTPNSLSTYVNRKKELHETFKFQSIQTGKSSLGVRLNKRSWFKGSIYKVKITPKELRPNEFIDLKS